MATPTKHLTVERDQHMEEEAHQPDRAVSWRRRVSAHLRKTLEEGQTWSCKMDQNQNLKLNFSLILNLNLYLNLKINVNLNLGH